MERAKKKQKRNRNSTFKENQDGITQVVNNDPDFKNKKSDCSKSVKDFQGMIYGGVNSRFWML